MVTRLPRLRLWLLVFAVALSTLVVWGVRSPAARFQWFRWCGDVDGAWREAVRALPSERLERALARLLVEVIEEKNGDEGRRGRAIRTLGCLPRAKDLSAEPLLELVVTRDALELDAVAALEGLHPLPPEARERLIAHCVSVHADHGASQFALGYLAPWQLIPPALWAPESAELASLYRECTTGTFRSTWHAVPATSLGADPDSLIRILRERRLAGRNNQTVLALLCDLGDGAAAATPEILEHVHASAEERRIALDTLIGLGPVAQQATEALLDPLLWEHIAASSRVEQQVDGVPDTLRLAAALTRVQEELPPEERRFGPAVQALRRCLRQPDLEPEHVAWCAALLEAMGPAAREAVPELLAGLPRMLEAPSIGGTRAILRALLVVDREHPGLRERLAELRSLDATTLTQVTYLEEALLVLDAGNPLHEARVIQHLFDGRKAMLEPGGRAWLGNRLDWSVGDPADSWVGELSPVYHLPRAPRPWLLERVVSPLPAERSAAASLIGQVGSPDRATITALGELLERGERDTWFAGIALLQLDALDPASDAAWLDELRRMAAHPVLELQRKAAQAVLDLPLPSGRERWLDTPWMERALETLPADELVAISLRRQWWWVLDAIPEDRLPDDLSKRLAVELERLQQGDPDSLPASAIDPIVAAAAEHVAPDRRRPITEVLSSCLSSGDPVLRVAAARGLARLGAHPHTWMPVLFEALRVDDPKRDIWGSLQTLHAHEW